MILPVDNCGKPYRDGMLLHSESDPERYKVIARHIPSGITAESANYRQPIWSNVEVAKAKLKKLVLEAVAKMEEKMAQEAQAPKEGE